MRRFFGSWAPQGGKRSEKAPRRMPQGTPKGPQNGAKTLKNDVRDMSGTRFGIQGGFGVVLGWFWDGFGVTFLVF